MICTSVSVAGVISTAFLTGRASISAVRIIDSSETKLSKKNVIKLVWRLYIPATATGLTTIAAILFAHKVASKKVAAISALYAASDTMFDQYRAKVLETLGKERELSLRDKIAQENVDRHPVSNATIIGSGRVLCLDTFSGRYFYSDAETIRRAQNDINAIVINDMYATLTQFYDLIGLPPTAISSEIGWNTDRLLEVLFNVCLSEDKLPCLSISFSTSPTSGFCRLQ